MLDVTSRESCFPEGRGEEVQALERTLQQESAWGEETK